MSETTNTVEEKKESVKLSGKLADLAKSIEGLTVLELADLVKGLEDKLGIKASSGMPAGMMMAMPAAGGAGAAKVEEKTSLISGINFVSLIFFVFCKLSQFSQHSEF